MTGYLKYGALALLVFGAGLVAAIRPSIATGHEGVISITCENVTFAYTSFPDAKNVVHQKITVDAAVTYDTDVAFTGTGATTTVTLNLTGEHTVSASTEWNTNGVSGSQKSDQKVECATPTTTTGTTTETTTSTGTTTAPATTTTDTTTTGTTETQPSTTPTTTQAETTTTTAATAPATTATTATTPTVTTTGTFQPPVAANQTTEGTTAVLGAGATRATKPTTQRQAAPFTK